MGRIMPEGHISCGSSGAVERPWRWQLWLPVLVSTCDTFLYTMGAAPKSRHMWQCRAGNSACITVVRQGPSGGSGGQGSGF